MWTVRSGREFIERLHRVGTPELQGGCAVRGGEDEGRRGSAATKGGWDGERLGDGGGPDRKSGEVGWVGGKGKARTDRLCCFAWIKFGEKPTRN